MAVSSALVPSRRRPVRQSAAYKATEKKLDSARKALAKRNKEVRALRDETEGGMITKGLTFTGGIALSSSLGFIKNKDGQPALNRAWRRGIRLLGGGSLILWGRGIHPLLKLFGWAIAGPELAFTSIEFLAKAMGRPVEIGALDAPSDSDEYGDHGDDWGDDYGAPEDEFDEDEDEDEDEIIVLDAS